jgi:hypothetical protein
MGREPLDIGAASDARFGHQQTIARHQWREPLGGGEVDVQGAKVAIVNADDCSAERDSAPNLSLVMRLDQHVHAEAARLGHDPGRVPIVEQRKEDEYGVCAMKPRLRHLARIDDEILGEDRAGKDPPHRAQVIERAAEEGTVGQHAHRGGDAGIGVGLCRSVAISRDHARGRRGFLDLHDEAGAAPSQGGSEAAPRRPGSPAQLGRRGGAEALRHLGPLAAGDLAEDSARLSHG